MRSNVAYRLRQMVCWILFLQLINLSIDPPDVNAVFQTKSLQQATASLTEKETVYEYLSEELLACDIPDSDEQEVERTLHAFELYFSGTPSFSLDAPALSLQHLAFYSDPVSCWEARPHAPPPKA